MLIEFTKEYLEELYYTGKASGKKYRFQPDIIKRYIKAINTLKQAETLSDLYAIRGLNYEQLSGDKNGLESVRVNDQYRIEFISIAEIGKPNIIKIGQIIELSNHYKK